MARVARVEAFALDEIATIHVMNRVVRRCFLMGIDELTGKNYDHRKTWVENEFRRLAAGFGIDLLTFSILSNHFHLILMEMAAKKGASAAAKKRTLAVRKGAT